MNKYISELPQTSKKIIGQKKLTKKMNIAIFRNNSSSLDIKSYNIQEIGLAKELAKKGFNVTIFSLFTNEPSPKEIFKENDCFVKIHPLKGLKIKNDIFYSFKSNNITIQNYDIVQVQEYSQIMNVFILQKAKKFGIKTIIYQGMYEDYKGFKYLLQKIYDNFLKKNIITNTDLIFSKTKSSLKFIEKKGFKNIDIVPVGLDISKFDKKIDFQDTSNRKNALYIGKLEERRHPHFLLDLAKKISQSGWTITLIGKGPLSCEIEERIKGENINNIIYIKEVDQENIAKYYLKANIFLLPTSNEIFGMVVLESLYFGTPVLSTPSAGPKDILQYQDNLGKCLPLDLRAWKNEIISTNLFKTDILNRQIRHNYIQQKYNWKSIAQQYIILCRTNLKL